MRRSKYQENRYRFNFGIAKFAILFCLFTVFLAPVAFAGGDNSGGGDAIICYEGIPYLTGRRVYLADTFDLVRSGKLQQLARLNLEQLTEAVFDHLDTQQTGLGAAVRESRKNLKFEYVDKVPELDDDDIKISGIRCSKQQLAVQHIPSGLVRVNKNLHGELSPLEKVLFEIHEAYIRIKNDPKGTNEVRPEVRGILDSSSFADVLAQYRKQIEPPRKEESNEWKILQNGVVNSYAFSFSGSAILPDGTVFDNNLVNDPAKIRRVLDMPKSQLFKVYHDDWHDKRLQHSTIEAIQFVLKSIAVTDERDILDAWVKSKTLNEFLNLVWDKLAWPTDLNLQMGKVISKASSNISPKMYCTALEQELIKGVGSDDPNGKSDTASVYASFSNLNALLCPAVAFPAATSVRTITEKRSKQLGPIQVNDSSGSNDASAAAAR